MALSNKNFSDYHSPRQVDDSEPSTGLKLLADRNPRPSAGVFGTTPTGEEVSNNGLAIGGGFGQRPIPAGFGFHTNRHDWLPTGRHPLRAYMGIPGLGRYGPGSGFPVCSRRSVVPPTWFL
jgi:hypothetical protein